MKSDEITKKLREEIRIHLDECNSTATPKICAEITTEEGYKKIEGMIISFMIKNRLAVGASIGQIESVLE